MTVSEPGKKSLLVNRVIPVSNVDGPGNRFSIFLQGCNLNCLYCHNPESINLCRNCGNCVSECDTKAISFVKGKLLFKPELCVECDKCLTVCPNYSTPRTQEIKIDKLIREIEKCHKFLSGITVSGGECTLQYSQIYDLFKKFKSRFPGLTSAIDTNALLDRQHLDLLCEVTDFFLVDLKIWNSEKHTELTGKENLQVLNNLKYLLSRQRIYEVRTVICPGFYDYTDTVEKTAQLLSGTGVIYRLIKFRKKGVKNRLKNSIEPEDSEMIELLNLAKKHHPNSILI